MPVTRNNEFKLGHYQTIREMHIKGLTPKAIASQLNNLQLPSRHGVPWHFIVIGRIVARF